MYNVSKSAASVLTFLTTGINEENTCKKIDNRNGTYMAVNINYVDSTPLGDLFSVSHTYEQNGDLMYDPEIVFLRVLDKLTEKKDFYPTTYRQDGLGIYREHVVFDENGNIRGYYKRMQKDCALFCNQWMKNIKDQQIL